MSQDRWQARVNDAWRFHFKIEGGLYRITDLFPHPKVSDAEAARALEEVRAGGGTLATVSEICRLVGSAK
jgi:hypothetical protein